MNTPLKEIGEALAPYRKALQDHPLYSELQHLNEVRLFMQGHVYAVWDFMSLLKALQQHLTSVHTPWTPAKDTETARFINAIVLDEETDVDLNGKAKSHFEMYLDAMEELGADTIPIHHFLEKVNETGSVFKAIQETELPEAVKDFLCFTFTVIETSAPHRIAAAFTFGREDVIPDMFLEVLNEAEKEGLGGAAFIHYLKRHIELDGDEHGPLSLQMVANLCGADPKKWEDVKEISIKSLQARLNLWDHLHAEMVNAKMVEEV